MKTIISILLIAFARNLTADDGHNLWLRGKNTGTVNVICSGKSSTIDISKDELKQNWQGEDGASMFLNIKHNGQIKGDGFNLNSGEVQANTDLGILYGVYEYLRRQQTGMSIREEIYNPSYELRILNHWDNLDGSIERGYAGKSIFWKYGKDSLVVTEKDKALIT